MQILVINPGSTTTKVAIFQRGEKLLFSETVTHDSRELEKHATIWEQYQMRVLTIKKFLIKNTIELKRIGAVVGRGGLLRAIPSGVYAINLAMLADLKKAKGGEHASNLGAPIAYEFAKEIIAITKKNIPSYIQDPVIVDELSDLARLSGHPLFPRKSIFHALGQKAVARRYAKSISRDYNSLNLIVAHMGGGITVGIHEKGMVRDVNNGLDGEGAMSPERAGTLPVGDVVAAAFSKKYTHSEMKKMLKGGGGMVSYLQTSNAIEVERRIASGDKYAELIFHAMAYQVAKMVTSLSAVVSGRVDGIILSGGLANSKLFTSLIKKRVEFLAPVHCNTSECEMSALANGAYSALVGDIVVKNY